MFNLKTKVSLPTPRHQIINHIHNHVNFFLIDFDIKAFEAECRKIVNDISDKFLDLGLDDGNHSDYGNMM